MPGKEPRVSVSSKFTPYKSPLGTNPSPKEDSPQKEQRLSFFGQIKNAISGVFFGRKSTEDEENPKCPTTGHLRTFPFRTGSGVCFFSIRKDQMVPFGFKHSQRLQYQKGAFSGLGTTVVGVRLGFLWVIDDDQEVAHPLPFTTRLGIEEAYEFQVIHDDSDLRPAAIPVDLGEDQLVFLQTAPDLKLQVGKEDDSQSTVILAPFFVPLNATVTLGWAGEATVTITGGGVEQVECSGSASVVIPVSSSLPKNIEGLESEDDDNDDEDVESEQQEEDYDDDEEEEDEEQDEVVAADEN